MKLKGFGVEQAGRFRLQTHGGKRGHIDHGWQDNLILDSGILRLLSTNGSVLETVSVGSGTTPPSVGQSSLVSLIASTTRNRSFTHGYNSEGGYGWTKMTVEFAQGAAAGNIGEVGVGWSASGLWSRALTLNAQGVPTVITVLPDEFLTVTYELRSWWITPEPYTITYDDDGIEKVTTVTHSNPTKDEVYNGAAAIYSRYYYPFINNSDANRHTSSWLSVSGNTVGVSAKWSISQGNVNGVGVAGAGNGALTGDSITGGSIPYSSSQNVATFDPPISKTNEFTVEIRGSLTISRRE